MKHIKVFEKFGEIDELFLGHNINKGELENGIYDSLIELSVFFNIINVITVSPLLDIKLFSLCE